MANQAFDGWLSKPQVAQELGVNDRTVERLVVKGDLHQAMMDVPGRRPLPMYDPAEVAALKGKMNPPVVLPANKANTLLDLLHEDRQKQLERLDALEKPHIPRRNPVPIGHRVFISLPEAAYRSGLMLMEIEELVKEGKLEVRERKVGKGIRRRLRNSDLDKL